MAALRGARAVVVIAPLFALALKVLGNRQIALFVGFGGIATLVMAGFGGGRRDELLAHLGLAVAGTALITIGTLVGFSVAVAAVVTVPVAFLVFFAGLLGPNTAIGATSGLLAYVLSAASPGTADMIPDRLAGWWFVSVLGTIAVLVTSRPAGADPLRTAAAALCEALADEIDAMLGGSATDALRAASVEARDRLLNLFAATPYRPTGLASAGEALGSSVELLGWAAAMVDEMAGERGNFDAAATDRELLASVANVLHDSGRLWRGYDASPSLDRLEALRSASIARVGRLGAEDAASEDDVKVACQASAIALVALAVGADALTAERRADAKWLEDGRTRGLIQGWAFARQGRRLTGLIDVASGHATVRSVWLVNSLRGALAIAAAIAVADLTSVQEAFWVVLGTLSVLRTSAASTGATALQALVGTLGGFLVGGGLLLAIGSDQVALWAALPVALAVTAYAPRTAPFAVGQAAFTVFLVVLFNLLAPVGWKVGVVRVEDVALGCAVSLFVGTLFWPRGAAAIVADDLADAFRSGGSYLRQAVDSFCDGHGAAPEAAVSAVTAAARLDYALRGFLAEHGTKQVSMAKIWRLVGGAARLRLTAQSVAQLPCDGTIPPALEGQAAKLETWYERLAALLKPPRGVPVTPPDPRQLDDLPPAVRRSPESIWLADILDQLAEHLGELIEPATHIADLRRRPWWR